MHKKSIETQKDHNKIQTDYEETDHKEIERDNKLLHKDT